MDRETRERLTGYVNDYAGSVWGQHYAALTDDQLLVIDVRADSYAYAHVEGEHNANGICHFTDAKECGERLAAAEFVECN